MKWWLFVEILNRIILLLKENKYDFNIEHHNTIPRDSYGAAKVRGSDVSKGAKALILQADQKLVQVVVPAHKRTRFNEVKKLVSAKRVCLASPEKVLCVTGCVFGSVPPLGVLWSIPVIIDTMLLQQEKVIFSAGTLTDSIYIKPSDLVKANNATVHSITY